MQNKKILQFLFYTTNITEIQDFLITNPKIDLTLFKSDKFNNVLHQNAFQNKLPIIKLYVNHMLKIYSSQSYSSQIMPQNKSNLIAKWVNQTNHDGFTPIHYASFKGNLQMIQYFQKLGAIIQLKTNLGLNIFHLAAQGDKLNVILYLYDKFNVNQPDKKSSTPLHWACYMGSEKVASFLLSTNLVNLNAIDYEQQTSLHLATMYGNTEIVKKLLLKGADRSLKNKKGQIALDIAKQNEFKNIQKMLLQNYTCLDQVRFYCNLKIKYKPTNRSIIRPLVFFFILLFIVISSHFILKTTIYNSFPIYALYIISSYYFLFILLFISLCQQPKSTFKNKDYKQLTNQIPICCQCRIKQQKRSYHCDICKVCVSNYDHHCPWINNCVGKNNIVRFLLFLILLMLSLVEIVFIIILGFMKQDFRLIFSTGLNNIYELIYTIILLIDLFVVSIFFLPILVLLGVQVNNLFSNQTTFERFSKLSKRMQKQYQKKDKDEQQISTPIKDGLLDKQQKLQNKWRLRNCVVMCCEQVKQEQN